MTKIESTINVNADINLQLTEVEARALNALTLYGTQTFLDVFYKRLGKTYLHKHEDGLISLFETIKNEMELHLNNIDNINKRIS